MRTINKVLVSLVFLVVASYSMSMSVSAFDPGCSDGDHQSSACDKCWVPVFDPSCTSTCKNVPTCVPNAYGGQDCTPSYSCYYTKTANGVTPTDVNCDNGTWGDWVCNPKNCCETRTCSPPSTALEVRGCNGTNCGDNDCGTSPIPGGPTSPPGGPSSTPKPPTTPIPTLAPTLTPVPGFPTNTPPWACISPNAPLSLTTQDLGGSIGLTWADGGTLEDGYRVWRGLPGSGVLLTTTGPMGPGTASYTDVGVACGTGQLYSVEAFNTCGSAFVTQNAFCATYESWFQTRDGGVTAAGGQVGTNLPPSASPVYLVLDGLNGAPGTVGGQGTAGNLNSTNANSKSWFFSVSGWTALLSRPDNSFIGIRDKITARVQTPVVISGTLNQAQLQAAIDGAGAAAKTPADSVVILVANGAVTLEGGMIDLGTRRALLVANGNVNINTNITLSSGGFWSVISYGNIVVDPTIGEATPDTDIAAVGYPPHLVGIYYAQGTFDTGTNAPNPDRQIRIDGTVIGIGGVQMRRSIPGEFPSEFVNFRPDLTLILHRIGLRTKQIQELQVP